MDKDLFTVHCIYVDYVYEVALHGLFLLTEQI